MTRPTRQVDLVTQLQPVDFCFFSKTTPFWIFLKIEIDPANLIKTRWLDQNLKSESWTWPATRPDLKIMGEIS
jgi:hypothetical protein